MRTLTLRLVMVALVLGGCRRVWSFAPRLGAAAPRQRRPSRILARSSTGLTTAGHATRYTIHCPPTDPEVLAERVRRHVVTFQRYLDRRPVAAHTAAAFAETQARLRVHATAAASPGLPPLILDSGCGTGRSTLVLGELFPEAIIVGVDKSLARLERNRLFVEEAGGGPHEGDDGSAAKGEGGPLVRRAAANVYLVRAELADFWRCALAADVRFTRHYLLYPNPYPKAARLGSRWYAHPALPLLLQTAPRLVVRSNWRQYLIELAEAVRISDRVLAMAASAGGSDVDGSVAGTEGMLVNYARPFVPSSLVEPTLRSSSGPCWSNFEQKYQAAGEPTYELKLEHTGSI